MVCRSSPYHLYQRWTNRIEAEKPKQKTEATWLSSWLDSFIENLCPGLWAGASWMFSNFSDWWRLPRFDWIIAGPLSWWSYDMKCEIETIWLSSITIITSYSRMSISIVMPCIWLPVVRVSSVVMCNDWVRVILMNVTSFVQLTTYTAKHGGSVCMEDTRTRYPGSGIWVMDGRLLPSLLLMVKIIIRLNSLLGGL